MEKYDEAKSKYKCNLCEEYTLEKAKTGMTECESCELVYHKTCIGIEPPASQEELAPAEVDMTRFLCMYC